jgi:GntR family transcriptional regulator, transcriptional repressor for pyruvate dehydrogenase complex
MAVRGSGDKGVTARKAANSDKEKVAALFAPLKPRRAFEEISAEIKRMIFSGVLKPGDRLPSETELGNQFAVSRQTIREAIRRLELAGFIVIQKGASGGPIVVNTILNTISDSFLDAFQMKNMTTDELTKARLEVEKMVLKNALTTIGQDDIAKIREGINEANRKIAQGLTPFGDDLNFHKQLARATGNRIFVILVEALMAAVAHFMSFLSIGVEWSKRANKAHERILGAIEKGDEVGALAELERHIIDADRAYHTTRNTAKGNTGMSSRRHLQRKATLAPRKADIEPRSKLPR